VIVDGKPFGVGIADPCSGLRSIVALVAVSVGYGYFAQRTWSRRAVLLVCSVPIAVFCNIVRIMSICLIARFASPSYATGQGHDFLGFIVFALGIYLTVLLSDLLNKIPLRAQSAGEEDKLPDEPETSSIETFSNVVSAGLKAIAPVALLVSVMIFPFVKGPSGLVDENTAMAESGAVWMSEMYIRYSLPFLNTSGAQTLSKRFLKGASSS
jgi:exosortase/archaeosortase family protein